MRSNWQKMLLGLACSVIATYHTGANANLPSGITPVMATWLFGFHALPSSVTTTDRDEIFRHPVGDSDWTKAAESRIKPGTRLPVVLNWTNRIGVTFRQHDSVPVAVPARLRTVTLTPYTLAPTAVVTAP